MSSSRESGAAHPLDAGPLAAIRRLSARETVRARIALAVEIGVLEPGERLPGSGEVAAAMGVSEGTVRRALTSLCESGVLHRKRGRTGGTFVAESPARGAVESVAAYTRDAETVRRLIDHRILLECSAAHLAAARGAPGGFDELHRLVEAMDAARTWAAFHELDARFHREVAARSGLAHAREELAGVLAHLHQYFLPYRMDTLRESNDDHRALVAALESGEAERAFAVTHRHVAALKDTMFIGIDH
jgi:DNA-binding FadR family transcriptional regulator